MENSTTTKSQAKRKPNLKPVLVSLASLVVVIGIGTATFTLLRQNLVKEADSKVEPAKQVKSAQELLDEFIKKDSIATLSTDYYELSNPQGSLVYAKADGKPYEIVVQTKHDALYTAKEGSADNRAQITDQVKAFLSKQGLQAIKSLQKEDDNSHHLAFKNSSAFCEFSSTKPIDDSANQQDAYRFACAENKLIEEQYNLAAQLLSVYSKGGATLNPSRVDISSESDNDVAYHIVYASNGDKTSMLLFGKVGDNIEYIANLAQGDIEYNNGKFNITPEVKTKLSDPKYKGYLLKQVAGVES